MGSHLFIVQMNVAFREGRTSWSDARAYSNSCQCSNQMQKEKKRCDPWSSNDANDPADCPAVAPGQLEEPEKQALPAKQGRAKRDKGTVCPLQQTLFAKEFFQRHYKSAVTNLRLPHSSRLQFLRCRKYYRAAWSRSCRLYWICIGARTICRTPK